MRLYCHRRHIYTDYARHAPWDFQPGAWREVPDELGEMLLQEHPHKFCDVSVEADPDNHVCSVTKEIVEEEGYRHTMMEAPPQHVMLTPRLSNQKRELLKKARKRSRIARLAAAGR